MNSSKSIKIILVILLVAVLGFIAFKYLNGTPAEEEGILGTVPQEKAEIGRDIIAELKDLSAINLDDSIFKGDVFLSLQDFSLLVTPEEQGRNNPFAPIGQASPVRTSPPSGTR